MMSKKDKAVKEDIEEEINELSADEDEVMQEDIDGQEEELSEEELLEDEMVEGEDSEEAPEGFAFAMAPIVRIMKDELDDDKMIRRRVKEGMNQWLESLCRKVAAKMNESEYTMVELDDFKTAIEPYEMIDAIEQERMRIVATLEKVKQDCDTLIMDVDRKFLTP